jgi:hypothetical protein
LAVNRASWRRQEAFDADDARTPKSALYQGF